MDSKALPAAEALKHVRRCLSDHGISAHLETPEDIERAIGELAAESYLDGYADHVAVQWQSDEEGKKQ